MWKMRLQGKIPKKAEQRKGYIALQRQEEEKRRSPRGYHGRAGGQGVPGSRNGWGTSDMGLRVFVCAVAPLCSPSPKLPSNLPHTQPMSELLGEGWEMGCLGCEEVCMDQKLRTRQETQIWGQSQDGLETPLPSGDSQRRPEALYTSPFRWAGGSSHSNSILQKRVTPLTVEEWGNPSCWFLSYKYNWGSFIQNF